MLHRRYRRLLWAYPSWYRRRRGQEILTTLLDAARPGQHRPTLPEAFDVVGRGLWYRVRPPKPGYVLLFVPVALFVALAGSVLAVRLTFTALAPIPTEDDAITMAEAATGQHPHNVPAPAVTCAPVCPVSWTPTGDGVVPLDLPFDSNGGLDQIMVAYWPATGQGDVMVAQAGERLTSLGWSVQNEVWPEPNAGSAVTAVKSGWQIRIGHTKAGLPPQLDGTIGSFPPVFVTVQHSRPDLATQLAMATLVAGPLAGWLLVNWVVGCYRQHRGARRTAILMCGVTAVVFAILTDLTMTWLTLPALVYVEESVRGPWPLLPAVRPATILLAPGVLAGIAALVLAAVPPRARPPRIASRTAA